MNEGYEIAAAKSNGAVFRFRRTLPLWEVRKMGETEISHMKERAWGEAGRKLMLAIRDKMKISQTTNPQTGDHVFEFKIGVVEPDEIDRLQILANERMLEANFDLRGQVFHLECKLYAMEQQVGKIAAGIVEEILQDQLEGAAEFMGRR